MTDERHDDDGEGIVQLAMLAEALHFSSVGWLQLHPDQDSDSALRDALGAHAATMWGAAVGAAKRLVREHVEAVPSELRKLASAAGVIEEKLPPALRALWRAHYIDGYEVAACAGAARRDYIEIIRFLMGEVRSRGADLSQNGGEAARFKVVCT